MSSSRHAIPPLRSLKSVLAMSVKSTSFFSLGVSPVCRLIVSCKDEACLSASVKKKRIQMEESKIKKIDY